MYSDEDSDAAAPAQRLHNQPYDEAFDVEDPDEIASHLAASPMPPRRSSGKQKQFQRQQSGNTPPSLSEDDDESSDYGGDLGNAQQHLGDAEERASESESDSVMSTEQSDGIPLEGAYDPADFADLPVSAEIKQLFQGITSYTPQMQQLDTRLFPFIPDFIPAVGDIDAFIKINSPDGEESDLGLDVLDEPCADQSDATVLDLQLRTIMKTATAKGVTVKTLSEAEENPKAIDAWISSISELHRQKPPQDVHYSHAMPDIDSLMQEWPEQFEKLLSKSELPGADLDVTLREYVEIACALLDIPVHHGSHGHIQALHVLMTLFVEFKNSQHFKLGGDMAGPPPNEPDTLTLEQL